MFKVGDKVVVPITLDNDKVREYTLTAVGRDTVQCGSSENTIYTAFVWPVKYKEELLTILRTRKELKRQFDDSIKLIYELKNKIARGE